MSHQSFVSIVGVLQSQQNVQELSNWLQKLYAELDTLTSTEKLIRELVAAGELPDPGDFAITSVCE